MRIIDLTIGKDFSQYAKRGRPKGSMAHRCGIDKRYGHTFGYDALSVMEVFTKGGKWPQVARAVGHKMPYGYLIGGDYGPEEFDGVIWRCLPDDVVGPHARAASVRYLSIGLIADPRHRHISEKQRAALTWLQSRQRIAYDMHISQIKGHGEVPSAHDGSKAPGLMNACPGFSQDMLDAMRLDVAAECRKFGAEALSGF